MPTPVYPPLAVVRHLDFRPAGGEHIRSRGLSLRVVSFNIEFGYCLEAIGSALQSVDADVICLQEVDWFHDKSGYVIDCFAVLCERLRMCGVWYGHHAYGTPYQGGLWGCAVLSRFPLQHAQGLTLHHLSDYPRSALGVVCFPPQVLYPCLLFLLPFGGSFFLVDRPLLALTISVSSLPLELSCMNSAPPCVFTQSIWKCVAV